MSVDITMEDSSTDSPAMSPSTSQTSTNRFLKVSSILSCDVNVLSLVLACLDTRDFLTALRVNHQLHRAAELSTAWPKLTHEESTPQARLATRSNAYPNSMQPHRSCKPNSPDDMNSLFHSPVFRHVKQLRLRSPSPSGMTLVPASILPVLARNLPHLVALDVDVRSRGDLSQDVLPYLEEFSSILQDRLESLLIYARVPPGSRVRADFTRSIHLWPSSILLSNLHSLRTNILPPLSGLASMHKLRWLEVESAAVCLPTVMYVVRYLSTQHALKVYEATFPPNQDDSAFRPLIQKAIAALVQSTSAEVDAANEGMIPKEVPSDLSLPPAGLEYFSFVGWALEFGEFSLLATNLLNLIHISTDIFDALEDLPAGQRSTGVIQWNRPWPPAMVQNMSRLQSWSNSFVIESRETKLESLSSLVGLRYLELFGSTCAQNEPVLHLRLDALSTLVNLVELRVSGRSYILPDSWKALRSCSNLRTVRLGHSAMLNDASAHFSLMPELVAVHVPTPLMPLPSETLLPWLLQSKKWRQLHIRSEGAPEFDQADPISRVMGPPIGELLVSSLATSSIRVFLYHQNAPIDAFHIEKGGDEETPRWIRLAVSIDVLSGI